MYRFYLAAVDMLPGALLLAPVYLVLHKTYFHNTGKSILYYLFSCYLAVVYVLVGLPNVTYIRPEVNLNLIPFAGMIGDWKNGLLNVLLFIPLGMSLPVLWSSFRAEKNALLFGFCTSLTIEFLQMLTYRATDINDVITNTFGTYLGFLFIKILLKKSIGLAHIAKSNRVVELWLVLTVLMLIMFFAYPFASAALWNPILS